MTLSHMIANKHNNLLYMYKNCKFSPVTRSRITLTSPDPSAVSTHKRSKRDSFESNTHEVTFIPHDDDTIQSDVDDNELHDDRDIKDESDDNKERKIVDEL